MICRVTLKAPVINACDAMTDAAVARATRAAKPSLAPSCRRVFTAAGLF